MPEKPVTFKVEGQQVVGMLHLPETKKARVPAVIMLHGFRGVKVESHCMFVKTARGLAQQGIAALRIDFRGSGDSEGSFTDATPSSEILDTHKGIAYLRRRKDIDEQRIGVVGMSFGGAIAAVVMGEDHTIKASVLWCPVAHPDALTDRRLTYAATGQLKKHGFVDMEGWPVGKAFIVEAKGLKPMESIVSSPAAVLLIHGTQDIDVPPTESRSYADVLKKAGRTVETRTIRGANHTYDSVVYEARLTGWTTDWFSEHL